MKADDNDIILWRMNRFEFSPLARLSQHLGRPLHMSLSPDKTTVGELKKEFLSQMVLEYFNLLLYYLSTLYLSVQEYLHNMSFIILNGTIH